MDQIMNKMGGYWLNNKAGKEISSVGDDFDSISTSIEGGTKWFVNKIKGKMQKPLPDLLREHDLPAGLFPRDATNYEFDEETKKLIVFIPTICEVGYRDQSILRFFTTVSGRLEKGKLTDVEGMKTKVLVWVTVTCVTTQASKVSFAEAVTEFMSQVTDLVKLVDSKDVVELQLKQPGCELIIRKKEALPQPPAPAPVMMMPSHAPPSFGSFPSPPVHAPQAAPPPTSSPPADVPQEAPKSSHPPITCPMSGTFYRSPAPGQPPFVKVGDKVKKGQILCIIEAMKLMNEIEADHPGTVVDILAEDGKPIGLDQPMLVIEPF